MIHVVPLTCSAFQLCGRFALYTVQITQDSKTYAKQGSSFSMVPKSLDLLYVLKYGEEHYVSDLGSSYMVGNRSRSVSSNKKADSKMLLSITFFNTVLNNR